MTTPTPLTQDDVNNLITALLTNAASNLLASKHLESRYKEVWPKAQASEDVREIFNHIKFIISPTLHT